MLQGEHSAILSTFIKLTFVIKIFVLSIFEWLLKTDFTVFGRHVGICQSVNQTFLFDIILVQLLYDGMSTINSVCSNGLFLLVCQQ